ncbi:hypothetical protein LQ938_07340 [Microbacterium sp. cx-55]|uniref:hypothetical protein n=1 Tax=unclassified Microbacterium TaxID=2609290 RepID=UPI001CBCADB3|nr:MULTISPECIES: hypothetical protein [unclassified Microbacterium]MBZ4486440.1 hypothetical protein [Microbacterium sp. cx-55]MCC4907412.1 hypothetical protein [Microbacterium sp. cx-59]UGB36587.1 hypothetical protein LQ938_07340 [Microbacterium sp. cx-55]
MVAAIALAASIAITVFVVRVGESSDGKVSILIDTFDSHRLLTLAVLVGFSALAAALCAIPARRWWLLLLVPVRTTALSAAVLAGGFLWVTSSVTVVPLVSAGRETGYVVAEKSFLLAGGGVVYRTDGIYVTAVADTSGDDGYHPFFDGAYTVAEKDGSLQVWYRIDQSDGIAPPPKGVPAFTLPILVGEEPGTCGIAPSARHAHTPALVLVPAPGVEARLTFATI